MKHQLKLCLLFLIAENVFATSHENCAKGFSKTDALGIFEVTALRDQQIKLAVGSFGLRRYRTNSQAGGFEILKETPVFGLGRSKFLFTGRSAVIAQTDSLDNVMALGVPTELSPNQGTVHVQSYPALVGRLPLRSTSDDGPTYVPFILAGGMIHSLDLTHRTSISRNPRTSSFPFGRLPTFAIKDERWRFLPIETFAQQSNELHFAIVSTDPVREQAKNRELSEAEIWVVRVKFDGPLTRVDLYTAPLKLKTGYISKISYKAERVLSIHACERWELITSRFGFGPTYDLELTPSVEHELAMGGW